MKQSRWLQLLLLAVTLAGSVVMAFTVKPMPKTFSAKEAVTAQGLNWAQTAFENTVNEAVHMADSEIDTTYIPTDLGSLCISAVRGKQTLVTTCEPDTSHPYYGKTTIKDGKITSTGSLKLSNLDTAALEGAVITYSIPVLLDSEANLSRQLTSYNLQTRAQLLSLLSTAAICMLIMALAIIFFPAQVEQETIPFRYLKSKSVESLVLFFVVVPLMLTGFTSLILEVIWGGFVGAITSKPALFTLRLFLGLCGFLLLWMGALFLCGFKFLCKEGPFVWFKSHSRLYRGLKKIANVSSDHWFNGSRLSASGIILYSLCLLLIMLTNSAEFAFVLGVILLVCLVIARSYIHDSWKHVNRQAELMAQGNFNTALEDRRGPFSPLIEKLRKIQEEYQRSLKEAVTSTSMKNELIANVSHDLKTPLTGLISYADLLQNTDDPQAMKKYAAKVGQYSTRLNQLVTDLFDVSKATSGNLHLEPVRLRLDQLLLEAVDEQQDEWAKRELKPVLELEACEVKLDPDKTMRIFENLFSNITKYALNDTRVFISLKQYDDTCRVEIKNISAVPLNFSAEEITERFVRGDKSRHEVGSGLGLAIAQSFTEAQQGKFHIVIDGDLFKAVTILPLSQVLPPVPDQQSVSNEQAE